MRVVVQRVSSASVTIPGVVSNATHASIARGLLILVGIENADEDEDVAWLTGKIARLRIFPDATGLMNLSVMDTNGEVLVVSQFTLFAATKKGNRPAFTRAARPEVAIPRYQQFVAALEKELGRPVQTGVFAANMQVALVNDGPVTIVIDSKQKE